MIEYHFSWGLIGELIPKYFQKNNATGSTVDGFDGHDREAFVQSLFFCYGASASLSFWFARVPREPVG